MHHKIKQSLISFFLFLLAFSASSTLFLSLLPTPSHAEISVDSLKELFGDFKNKTPQDYAKEFCDKRNGELMNLETWFSGKCGPDVDSKSGEGVGFVDIIILQAYEWMYSPQYKSFPEQVVQYLNDADTFIKAVEALPINGTTSLNNLKVPQFNNSGILSGLETATKYIVNTKPATSTDYIAYVSNNLHNKGIVKNTYAAGPGYGFTSLGPLLGIWKAFRNIAYILFALAFVLYGIMIMFRIRIDSKTAATIQLAIPKLIATLLLITFSYAIVGLLVDITTVLSALVIDVLRLGGILTYPIGKIVWVVSGQTFLGAVGSFALNWISGLIMAPAVAFNMLLGGALGATLGTLSVALGWTTALGQVLIVVITLAIFISYVKLVGKLMMSYINVMISLIFSPIILLGNVLPGSKAFSSWILSLVGNLAVFPVASFCLVLSYVLMLQPLLNIPGIGAMLSWVNGINQLTETWSTIWTPPLTAAANSSASIMLATLGLGLLLMASKYVDMVQKALSTPQFGYGSAIGEALKFGSGTTAKLAKDTSWETSANAVNATTTTLSS